MSKLPTIHETRPVASSRLFHVEEVHLEFSNGERRIYERLANRGHGAVLIVPMLDDDTLLLIREYSAGTERYELAFPKGHVERGEDILDAANREIQEEVGYGAHELHLLRSVSVSPSYMAHHTNLVLARNLYPLRMEGDEPEPLEVVPWKLSDIDSLLLQPDFTEGRSLLALYLAQAWLKQHG
jgi:ADP-ribose diphosphatase